jgi:hypothetical protein
MTSERPCPALVLKWPDRHAVAPRSSAAGPEFWLCFYNPMEGRHVSKMTSDIVDSRKLRLYFVKIVNQSELSPPVPRSG